VIKQIIREIRDIQLTPLEGVKLIPNEEDVSDIQAIIDGPEDTPFQGGIFKVKVCYFFFF